MEIKATSLIHAPRRLKVSALVIGQALQFDGGNIVVRLQSDLYLKVYSTLGSQPDFYTYPDGAGTDDGTLLPQGTTFNLSITI